MIWSIPRFQHSIELFPRVLKEAAPVLLPISFLLWGLEFYVAWLNKARFSDPYSSSMTLIVVVGLSGVILQSFASVIWILFVAKSTQRQMKNGHGPHPLRFLKTHFHQSFIEYLRSFISVGIYSLFLIVPGIFRWVQLQFSVLISAFDPSYLEGKKDALKESSRLVRGAWFAILFYLLLQMIIPLTLEEVAKSVDTPAAVTVLLYAASWCFNLFLAIYFSLTFFARWSLKLEKN